MDGSYVKMWDKEEILIINISHFTSIDFFSNLSSTLLMLLLYLPPLGLSTWLQSPK
jgi:hypothetical protein